MAASCGGRVVVFPFPFQGHFNPVMRLARALHARGVGITVFHTAGARAPDPADYPADYRFVPVPVEVAPELMASEDIAAIVTALNAACEAPFRDRLSALLSAADGEAGEAGGRVRCVLTDVSWDAVLSAARGLGVPALGVMTASAATFRVYMAYRTLVDKGYLPVREERKDDAVAELPPYRVKDLLRHETCDLEEFADLLGRVVAAARLSSGLIFHTFPFIEAGTLGEIRDDMSVPVYAVAPLNKLVPAATASLHGEVQADRGCLRWLDAQRARSVLYVSFGSMAAMDPHEFVELAWGLADAGRPFVWVVRPNLIRGFESGALPDGVEDRVRGRGVVVSWAPQEEVLAHPAVGGFFTHCGWNSTVEAVSEGVPMICHPRHGDQYGNARYVCHVWKVGTEVAGDQLERGEIKAAIDRLMGGSEEGEGIRKRMNELKIAADKGIDESAGSDLTNLVHLINSY
ncbi:benzoxazinone synthesis8 [Zea mays]|nr:benzoxazinone synthesis8 [Zea mays]